MATNGELVPSSGITKLMVKFSLGVPRVSALGHKRTSIALRDRAHGQWDATSGHVAADSLLHFTPYFANSSATSALIVFATAISALPLVLSPLLIFARPRP